MTFLSQGAINFCKKTIGSFVAADCNSTEIILGSPVYKCKRGMSEYKVSQ